MHVCLCGLVESGLWVNPSPGCLSFHNLPFCCWNLTFFHFLYLNIWIKEANFAAGNYVRGKLIGCFVRKISVYSRYIFYPPCLYKCTMYKIYNPKYIVLMKSLWSNIKILYMLVFIAKTLEDTSAEVFFCILKVRGPQPQNWCLMIWSGADIIITERNKVHNKCDVLESFPDLWSLEKLSSMKLLPGAEKVGDHCFRLPVYCSTFSGPVTVICVNSFIRSEALEEIIVAKGCEPLSGQSCRSRWRDGSQGSKDSLFLVSLS